MDWQILRYDEVDSTNEVCKALAAQGAGNIAVIAAAQTAGKGRLGRSFRSPPGGLYLSVLWRDCPADQLFSVTPMAAVAVCRAVFSVCGARCGIKWCNDVLLRSGKLSGILTETCVRPLCPTSQKGSQKGNRFADWLVVGIGVNVGQTSFPPDIADMATSLALQGFHVSPDTLADAILTQLTSLRAALSDPAEWLSEYRSLCHNLGKQVQVLKGGNACRATALAVDDQFGLTVRYEDGSIETVRSGEVSVRGTYGYAE